MQPKHIAILDSYVQGMISIANERLADNQWEKHGCPPLHHWLEDFRTIGFKIPRQLGALHYVETLAIRDPSALLIVRDDAQREMLRDSFTRDGTYIPAHCSPDASLNKERGLPSAVMNRIITIRQLHSYFAAHESSKRLQDEEQWKSFWNKVIPIDKIYISEGKQFFSKVKSSKFYQYAAEVMLDKDGLIITAQ